MAAGWPQVAAPARVALAATEAATEMIDGWLKETKGEDGGSGPPAPPVGDEL